MNDPTNDPWVDRISEYLDGELGAGEREAFEGHLRHCADCQQILEDLRSLALEARRLPEREPPPRVWEAVAARLGEAGEVFEAPTAEPSRGTAPAPSPAPRRVSFTLQQLAMAAAVVILLSGTTGWLAGRVGRATSPLSQEPGIAAPLRVAEGPEPAELRSEASPVDRVDLRPLESDMALAAIVPGYAESIGELEQTLVANLHRLDEETLFAIQENLRLLDEAITQARLALQSDPDSDYLSGHLAQTMRQKVRLLRRANDIASIEI